MRLSKLFAAMAASTCTFSTALPALLIAGSAAAAEPAQTSAGIVEEIIVTSRRTEESIQDVPVAVSAFTQQDIQRIAPYTLVDMDGLMPNVSISQQTAGPSMGAIFIRGIGSADVERATPPQVGVVLDGIFMATNTGQLIDMFDIEQIEVNRGPQGVLYGKNTTGGTIVARRTQPDLEKLTYKASAEGGTYNDQLYKARVSVPLITDQLALKVAGAKQKRDGFYQNQLLRTDDGDVDYATFTTSLKWQPSDALTAVVWYDNIDDNGNFGIPNDPYWDGNQPFKNQANLKQKIKYQVDTVGMNVQYDLGNDMMLESITGYVDTHDIVQQDFDNATLVSLAIPIPQLHTLRNQTQSVTSEELRLTGPLAANVTYTLGALYYNSSLTLRQGTNVAAQIPNPLPPGVPCAVIGANPNPLVGNAVCQFPAGGSYQETNQQGMSTALYGSVNWQVADNLELSAGMRHLNEDVSFKTAFYNAVILPGDIQPPHGAATSTPFVPFPVTSNNDWSKTIGEATATFHLSDTNMVYARWSQGYRSGGISNRGTDPKFLSYSPEKANAYEIGSKNEFFDRRLQLNLTGFYTVIEDAQFVSILSTAAPPGTNTIVNNAGGNIDTYGFELQSSWQINDLFSVIATYGYQDNKVDDFQTSSEVLPVLPGGFACNPATAPGGVCRQITLGGGDLGRAPKYNYSFTAVYSQDFGRYNFTLSGTARGQDDIILVGGATSSAVVTQDAYTLYDARAALQWNLESGSLLRLSLIGKNLNDEEYLQEALPLGNGGFQGWGPPRTIAVELLYQN